MVKYILKRLILVPIILLLVSVIIFGLINLSPVDPASSMLPSTATQEDRDALHAELGLDKPIYIQYLNYMKNLLHGNLGTSWYYKTSVWEHIRDKIPVTAKIALFSTLITVLIGLPLGVICATHQYQAADEILNGVSKVLGSMPNFWMALMLMLLFSVKLGWLPLYGFSSWTSWILPLATITIQTIGTYLRIARSSMLDSIRQDYVRTARAKGCKERTVIYNHALKNALLPIITFTGQMFASMMGGAVVVETVFSLPGLGSSVVHAVKVKDIPLAMSSLLIISAIFLVAALIIDLCYVVADPRVKANFETPKRIRKSVEAIDDDDDDDDDTLLEMEGVW